MPLHEQQKMVQLQELHKLKFNSFKLIQKNDKSKAN